MAVQPDWWNASPTRAPTLGAEPPAAQGAAIADAVVAHDITDAAADLDAANETELEGFYDALGVQINAVLAALRTAGIIAT